MKYDELIEGYEDFGTIGEAFLAPTKIYAKPVLEMHKASWMFTAWHTLQVADSMKTYHV